MTVCLPTPSRAASSGTSTRSRPVTSPPYYRGEPPSEVATVGNLPVAVAEPHEGLPANWIPTDALDRVAADVTNWVGEQHPAGDLRELPAPDPGRKMMPPVVYLGCSLDATGECIEEPRENVLEMTSANRAWREGLASVAREANVDLVVSVRISLAPLWIQQRNLKGSKVVRLGTSNSQSLPWLTSLDTPVYVLQLTGAVVDAEGRVVRGGAEGIWAVRTPFSASVLDSQKLISAEDVERVRTELRREDLPGSPLLWQAAVSDLFSQLLGSRFALLAASSSAP